MEQDGQRETTDDDWEDPRLTEARNPRTVHIDRRDVRGIVELIQAEDRRVPPAVEAQADAIAELVERVTARLERGGRLFYAGAGTSGRLGVLDAAECPPTFGTDPGLVQGLIAGGRESLVRSREGVEDDREAGRRAVREAGVGPDDFLLGIATSGTTPWVLAAMDEAARRDAGTGFLSCTDPPEEAKATADVLVTPRVGPEVIAGSTRMKAGTATKLVLNTLSTAVMIRRGKVYENLMVDLQAVSMKLVDRGIRIVRALTGVGAERARSLIGQAGGSVKTALAMEELDLPRAGAERVLDAAGGRLREAVERWRDSEAIPYYACYPPAPDGPEDARRLLRSLTEGPHEVADAVGEAGDCLMGPGWGPAGHLAHLVEFEREGVRPRVERVAHAGAEGTPNGSEGESGDGGGVEPPAFPDLVPSRRPDGADRPVPELVEAFRREREDTLERLRGLLEDEAGGDGRADGPPLPRILERRMVVGDEEMSLHQFLRGVAHHDRAHALRIREHVHPALREDGEPA